MTEPELDETIAQKVDRIIATAAITAWITSTALDREIENRINKKLAEHILHDHPLS